MPFFLLFFYNYYVERLDQIEKVLAIDESPLKFLNYYSYYFAYLAQNTNISKFTFNMCP